MSQNDGTVLHTLERGLHVLEAVAVADGTATAKMLSRQLGLKIGTCCARCWQPATSCGCPAADTTSDTARQH